MSFMSPDLGRVTMSRPFFLRSQHIPGTSERYQCCEKSKYFQPDSPGQATITVNFLHPPHDLGLYSWPFSFKVVYGEKVATQLNSPKEKAVLIVTIVALLAGTGFLCFALRPSPDASVEGHWRHLPVTLLHSLVLFGIADWAVSALYLIVAGKGY